MLFHFTPLNTHHNYYIFGRKPWDYDNGALVTLCSRCHQKRHQQTKIPLYTSDRQLICSALPVCDRCDGLVIYLNIVILWVGYVLNVMVRVCANIRYALLMSEIVI